MKLQTHQVDTMAPYCARKSEKERPAPTNLQEKGQSNPFEGVGDPCPSRYANKCCFGQKLWPAILQTTAATNFQASFNI